MPSEVTALPGSRGPRRRAVLGAIGLAAVPRAAPRAQDAYPSRPISIVDPFPPGGTLDTLARTLAEQLRAALGQPVIVDNRAGGAGHVGTAYVARAQPDGYTLLAAPQLSFNADLLYPNLPYDPRGLEPVSVLAAYPNVIVARRDLPVADIPALLALARGRPDGLTYGSQGNGQIGHLTCALLGMLAGLRLTHVPYRGSAPMLTALLAGEVDLGADNLLATAGHIRAGGLKLLAVTGTHRLPDYPDVPTVAETVPGFVSDTWVAIAAPPRTPLAIRARLAAAIGEAVRTAGFRERLVDVQAEPVGGTPDTMAAMIRESRERWEPVVRTAGVRVE